MTVKFRRYDTANYLTNETEIAAYLAAVADENDPSLTVAALADVARARNISQLARDADISREGLYKALSPGGNPSFATVSKIANALGLRIALQPTGIVETSTQKS